MNRKLIFTLLFFGITSFDVVYAQEAVVSPEPTQPSADSIVPPNKVNSEISVTQFRRLENDITARIVAPKRDQNNEVCAIIKVVTKDKGLFFEPDALGIVARTDQPGEIWLYVPHGAKRITIKHESFGILRNYFYNESIDKATVYELAIQLPQKQQTTQEIVYVEKEITTQVLMMNYSPTHAHIYIDDTLQVSKNGAFLKDLSLGKHRYRIVASHYESEEGEVNLVPEKMSALNVNLLPTFGFISASSTPAARIEINKKTVGTSPYSSDTLAVGTYTVRAERKWHVPQEQRINVKPSETTLAVFNLRRQKPNRFLMAQYASAFMGGEQSSFGLMAGICRKGGAYFSVRANGVDNLFEGEKYYSSGTPLFTGKVDKYVLTGTGGFMVRLANPLYLYGGAGFGTRKLLWETVEGTARDYDRMLAIREYTGPVCELGFIGRYKFLSISAGVSAIIGEDGTYAEAVIGIGYVFGR